MSKVSSRLIELYIISLFGERLASISQHLALNMAHQFKCFAVFNWIDSEVSGMVEHQVVADFRSSPKFIMILLCGRGEELLNHLHFQGNGFILVQDHIDYKVIF